MPRSPAPDPLRLLHILGGAAVPGEGVTGVERVVQALIQNLDPQRFEHSLAYPETGELRRHVQARLRATLSRLPRKRYDRLWMDELADFVQSHRIDLVVTHGWRADFLTALTCRRLRKPHVVARAAPLADEATLGSFRKWLYGLVDAWTLRGCTGIVTVSEASKERMRLSQHLPAERITVIPNGVQIPPVSSAEREAARRSLAIEPSAFLVGAAGRLVPGKGFDVLLEALALLQRRAPETTFRAVVLGEGPERPGLEQRARSLGVSFHLPGFVRTPYACMAAFDVAVLPSRAEGMPLAVLESMALGIPTVATAVGGCREIIQDGKTGVLIPVGDPEALAVALARLAADPAARRRLGTAAAQAVRSRYSLDAMVGAWDAFLTGTVSHWYGREEKRTG